MMIHKLYSVDYGSGGVVSVDNGRRSGPFGEVLSEETQNKKLLKEIDSLMDPNLDKAS